MKTRGDIINNSIPTKTATRGFLVVSLMLSAAIFLPSTARASNWFDVHVHPGSTQACAFAQTNDTINWDPGNGISQQITLTTPISSSYDSHGRSSNVAIFYKWSNTPCGSPGAAFCGQTQDSTWLEVLSNGTGGNENNACNQGSSPTTTLTAARAAPWGLSSSGPFYLLISFHETGNPEIGALDSSAGYQFTYPGGVITNVQPNNGTDHFDQNGVNKVTGGQSGDTNPEGVYGVTTYSSFTWTASGSTCLLLFGVHDAPNNGGPSSANTQLLTKSCPSTASNAPLSINFGSYATPQGGRWHVLAQLVDNHSGTYSGLQTTTASHPYTSSNADLLDQWPENANATDPYDFTHWGVYYLGAQVTSTPSGSDPNTVTLNVSPVPGSFSSLNSYGSPKYAFVPAGEATATPAPDCAAINSGALIDTNGQTLSLTKFSSNATTTVTAPDGDTYLFVCLQDSENNNTFLPLHYPMAYASNSIIDPTSLAPNFPIHFTKSSAPTFVSPPSLVPTGFGSTWYNNSSPIGAGITLTVQGHGAVINAFDAANKWMWIPYSAAVAAGYSNQNPTQSDSAFQSFIVSAAALKYANAWGTNSTVAADDNKPSITVNAPYNTDLGGSIGRETTDGPYLLAFSVTDKSGNVLNYPVGYYQVDSHAPSLCLRVWPTGDANGDRTNYCDSCQSSCAGIWNGVYQATGNSFNRITGSPNAFTVPVSAELIVSDNQNYPTGVACADPSGVGVDYSGIGVVGGTLTTPPTSSDVGVFTSQGPQAGTCTNTYLLTQSQGLQGVPGQLLNYSVSGNAADNSTTLGANAKAISNWNFWIDPPSYTATDFHITDIINETDVSFQWTAAPTTPASYRIVNFNNDGSTNTYTTATLQPIAGTDPSATIRFKKGNFNTHVELEAQDPTNPTIWYTATVRNQTGANSTYTTGYTNPEAVTSLVNDVLPTDDAANIAWSYANALGTPNTTIANTTPLIGTPYGTSYSVTYTENATTVQTQTACIPASPSGATGPHGDSLNNPATNSADKDSVSMNLLSLIPNTWYSNVTVTAFNGDGTDCSGMASLSSPANTFSFYTLPDAPNSISSVIPTSTGVTATIVPSNTPNHQSGPNYYLRVEDPNGNFLYSGNPAPVTNSPLLTQSISGLTPGIVYTVSACTWNTDPSKQDVTNLTTQACVDFGTTSTSLSAPSFSLLNNQNVTPAIDDPTETSFALSIGYASGEQPACVIADVTYTDPTSGLLVEKTTNVSNMVTNVGGTPVASPQPVLFTADFVTPNSGYTVNFVKVGAKGCSSSDKTLSPKSATPPAVAWTLPSVSAPVPTGIVTTANSITAQFGLPTSPAANPVGTTYSFVAVIADLTNGVPAWNGGPGSVVKSATSVSAADFHGATTIPVTVTGLQSGTPYYLFMVANTASAFTDTPLQPAPSSGLDHVSAPMSTTPTTTRLAPAAGFTTLNDGTKPGAPTPRNVDLSITNSLSETVTCAYIKGNYKDDSGVEQSITMNAIIDPAVAAPSRPDLGNTFQFTGLSGSLLPNKAYYNLAIQLGNGNCDPVNDPSLSAPYIATNPTQDPNIAWTLPSTPNLVAVIPTDGTTLHTTIGAGAGNPSTTQYSAVASINPPPAQLVTGSFPPATPNVTANAPITIGTTPQTLDITGTPPNGIQPGQSYFVQAEAISGSGIASLNVYTNSTSPTTTPIGTPGTVIWLNSLFGTPAFVTNNTVQTPTLAPDSIALGIVGTTNATPKCALLTYSLDGTTQKTAPSTFVQQDANNGSQSDWIFNIPNAADTQIHLVSMQIGNGDCTNTDPSLSAKDTTGLPAQNPWTMPNRPTIVNEISATATSMTVIFNPATGNPSTTQYVAVAFAGSLDTSNNNNFIIDTSHEFDSDAVTWTPTTPGQAPPLTPLTIPGTQGAALLPGHYYGIFARANSSFPINTASDLQINQALSTYSNTGADVNHPYLEASTAFSAPTAPAVEYNAAPTVTTPQFFTLNLTSNNADQVFPPPFTYVTYTYTDNTVTPPVAKSGFFITPTLVNATATDRTLPLAAVITVPSGLANTAFLITSVKVGGFIGTPGVNDPTWSLPVVPQPGVATGYTLPVKPNNPTNPVTTATSVTLTENEVGDGNPATTTPYAAETDLAGTGAFTSVNASNPNYHSKRFAQADTQVTITGLTSGISYVARNRAVSLYQPVDGSAPYDQFSDIIPVNTPIGSGNIVNVTTNTIEVAWTVTDVTNVTALSAIATDWSNTTNGVNGLAATVTLTPDLTVTALQPSNTSYTVTLWKTNTDGTNTKYIGSEVVATLHAATPPAPTANFTGTAQNITLSVTMTKDLYNDSRSSQYGVKISIDNGATWQYLDTSGNLSGNRFTEPFTTTPLVLNSVQLKTTYIVETFVMDNHDLTLATPTPTEVNSSSVTVNSPGEVFAKFTFPNGTVALDNYIFGVPQNAAFYTTFTTDIDPATDFKSFFKLTTQADPSTPLNITFTYDKPSRTVTVQPSQLAPSTVYFLTVLPGIFDSFDIGQSTLSFTTEFVSGLDIANGSTVKVTSPHDLAVGNSLTVQPNVFAAGSYPVLRTSFISPSAPAEAIGGAASNPGLGTYRPVEVLFYTASGASASAGDLNTTTPVTLTLSNKGLTPNAAIDPKSYSIYYQGPGTNILTPIASTINSDGSVSASVFKSGLYFLGGPVMTDVSGAYAYPVPYRPASGHTLIHFKGVVPGATVRVYTIMGELVKEIPGDGSDPLDWDVTNKHGEKVASGVYIYQIKDAFSEKRGKLIIVR